MCDLVSASFKYKQWVRSSLDADVRSTFRVDYVASTHTENSINFAVERIYIRCCSIDNEKTGVCRYPKSLLAPSFGGFLSLGLNRRGQRLS